MVDAALEGLSAELNRIYSHTGRPSIPPEKLLKALILQALYSIRSNRMLTEQIGYSILFRWFLGMALDEPVWDHSSFTQNQQRLIGSEAAGRKTYHAPVSTLTCASDRKAASASGIAASSAHSLIRFCIRPRPMGWPPATR